jgi:aspartyl-tRNA(Asn)/glutamyl-tRNA(Gln) amidotransferase subunit A
VPAALCGLAGYRATLGRGDWRGAAHLAPSFDTIGWLFRDLEEVPLLAGFFAPAEPALAPACTRFGIVDDSFLHDCEPDVVTSYKNTISEMEAIGLRSTRLEVSWWGQSAEIFAPIQASEAAGLHGGHFDQFETAIRERLRWGASLTPAEISDLRRRHVEFRMRMDELFAAHELILLPAAPVARLAAGDDHTNTRQRLLRYTTPFSLAGAPAVTIPCQPGGMQLAAARDADEALLTIAAVIGAHRKAAVSVSNG